METKRRNNPMVDVIVIGGGIMGSCTAYQLSNRGYSTLLLEQFDFLHHRGSSHGESRTLRTTYPQPHYSSMAIHSSRLWNEAQSQLGYQVLYPTTQLDIAPSSDKSIQSIIASCRANLVEYRVLDRAEGLEEFKGGVVIPEGWIGLVTKCAGVIKPTKAVSMFQTLAIQKGAVIRDNSCVKEIVREGDQIMVLTVSGETFYGNKCVVTAGAWTAKLVKNVIGRDMPIQPLETTICYWKIKEAYENEYSLKGGFPTFAIYGHVVTYGTPSLEYPGLIKVSVHGGHPCDPDRRTWRPQEELMESLKQVIKETFGGRVEHESPVLTQSCMYSMTPDEDFVIDFLGGEFGKDVVIAGGFSGHGFKMGPVIGKILADLVLHGDAEGIDLDHFKIARFDNNLKGDA